MANFELWYDQDIAEPIKQKTVPHSLFMQDGLSNKIGVRVTKNGEPYELSGKCYYLVLRSDGYTVMDEGAIEGNTIYATPAYSSYLTPGRTQIFLRCVDGDVKTVLLALAFDNKRTTYGSYIDPSHIIPDVNDIIAKFEEMEEELERSKAATDAAIDATDDAIKATNEANAAASLANQKAELADEKAQLAWEAATIASAASALAVKKAELAEAAAQNADEKASLADEKAQLADTSAKNADEKAGLANTAAKAANDAATLANEKAGLANSAATLANEKAELADQKAKVANEAAELANEKAGLADTAAKNADEKAGLANTAASAANKAATLANQKAELAEEKAGLANTAAERANKSAKAVEDMTVEAEQLAEGAAPTAGISTVDEHYHIKFGIPKGDTGDNASIKSETAYFQNSQDGTTIPTGTWQTTQPVTPQGQYLWIKYHRVWNNGQETDEYTVSRMGIDGSGSVVSVMGYSPDSGGNVSLAPAVQVDDDTLCLTFT